MISLSLADRPRRVLALGAHPDDIEIGCGGSLLSMARRWAGIEVTVVVLTGSPLRQEEARVAADLFLPGARICVRGFDLPDGRLRLIGGRSRNASSRSRPPWTRI